MISSFFSIAAVSPTRQRSFRCAVAAHVILLYVAAWWASRHTEEGASYLGYIALTMGIAEGAVVAGWRLTQLPRSQALEFLLVSPMRPPRVFLAEGLIGLSRLALVSLSGLPVLILLMLTGFLLPHDLAPLLLMPFTWGAITALGLTVWAYELKRVRVWGERVIMALILVYLIVGVAAGEHLVKWIQWLPEELGQVVLISLAALHRYNPFTILHDCLTQDYTVTLPRLIGVEMAALVVLAGLLMRASMRLHGHFHDRHYRPAVECNKGIRVPPGDRPLSWWALRRVSEYSGRINLWLASGFGVLYALYTVAGPLWPSWLGRRVFIIFDGAGGVPVWATALVVLAAVPAAFQYGLWDSNALDRSRRLELLLLTQLTAADYWHAAAVAAWQRGRGYFAVAILLWAAAALTTDSGLIIGLAAVATGVLLWCLYFAIGFWAFSRGMQTNNLGMILTLGLPALALAFHQLGWPSLVSLVPPGAVYSSASLVSGPSWLVGSVLCAAAVFVITRLSLAQCEAQLRNWYDNHHGVLVME